MKRLNLLLLSLLSFPFFAFSQLADSTSRVVNLEGAVNFRDAGGYKTANGKMVVQDRIFRSADISQLTDNDMGIMANKQIRTIIDFRGTKESAASPDRLLPGADYTLCPAGSDNLPSTEQMIEAFKQEDFLMKMYGAESVKYYGDRYRPLFVKLLTLPDNESLLFHCAAGRDRTGMAAALLLYTLQVPMDIIEADFTASNIYLKYRSQNIYTSMAEATGLSPEKLESMMLLRPELIRNFFSSISNQYGSIENFLEVEMGIGERELNILRTKYTY